MPVKRERAAQAETTRQTLLQTARRLFAQQGYAEVSTDEVVRRAKVTKGALYHHFANKLELYVAVIEDMERELVTAMEVAARKDTEPEARLRAVCLAYLDACLDSSLARLLVLEVPVVLGWKAWCDLAHKYEVGVLERHLSELARAGRVRDDEPLQALAHVLLGALNTAARVIATAPDPANARVRVEGTIDRLLQGLVVRTAPRTKKAM